MIHRSPQTRSKGFSFKEVRLLKLRKIVDYSLAGLLLGLSMTCNAGDHTKYIHDCNYKDRQTPLTALACNIYFESRGESLIGRQAVGFVTLNRVDSDRFPDGIVDVVYQPWQFSWHKDGKSDKVYDKDSWLKVLHISVYLLGIKDEDYHYVDITEGSLFYHSKKVNPLWASEDNIVVTIDNHLFYKKDLKK